MTGLSFGPTAPGRDDSMRPYVIGSVVGHVVFTLVMAWVGQSLLEPPPSLQLLRVDLATIEMAAEEVTEEVAEPVVESSVEETPVPEPTPEPVVEESPEPVAEESSPPVPTPPEDVVAPRPELTPEKADPELRPDPQLVDENLAEPETELPRPPEPTPEPVREEDLDFLEPSDVDATAARPPAEATAEERTPAPVAAAEEETVAAGASVQATASEGIDDSYLKLVQTKIGRRWRPTPASTRGQSGVLATVRFRIGPAGQVIAPTIVQSSGLSVFDRQALVAVERSSPLPAPPARFGDEGVEIDFHFRFTR